MFTSGTKPGNVRERPREVVILSVDISSFERPSLRLHPQHCFLRLLLQGLAHVISTLQAAPAANAIRRLAQPIAAALQRDGVEQGDVKGAQHDLDRLTALVSHLNPRLEVGLDR